MEFAKRESEANKSRRELLLQAADPTWRPVEDSELPDKSVLFSIINDSSLQLTLSVL